MQIFGYTRMQNQQEFYMCICIILLFKRKRKWNDAELEDADL